ncbi:MAG: chemotaxis protein CheC [Pseudomonadota bacterium]
MNDPLNAMSPLEKDALQEIMNISFGQAAADLSEVINMYVTLTVPFINILRIDEIYPCIRNEVSAKYDMSMIRQFFSGKFSGSSILIFPHGEGKKLLQLFDESVDLSASSGYDSDILEKETLIEISNIIMGACVSKIAGLLGDMVNFTPPRYYAQDQIHITLNEAFAGDDAFAIFFKTVFHFKEFDASGFLFLISNYSTLEWLKKAIEGYMNQYA